MPSNPELPVAGSAVRRLLSLGSTAVAGGGCCSAGSRHRPGGDGGGERPLATGVKGWLLAGVSGCWRGGRLHGGGGGCWREKPAACGRVAAPKGGVNGKGQR